jgi:hypothetical protein
MAYFRRQYMALLREISVTTRHYDPGDRYMRWMEWMAAAIGLTFAASGLLMLSGVLDLYKM